jgi:hypothetical protein
MSTAMSSIKTPQVQIEGERLVIPVDCRHAEGLQNHLRRQGIGSTICLVPYSEEARLEVWAGTDATLVQAALEVTGS